MRDDTAALDRAMRDAARQADRQARSVEQLRRAELQAALASADHAGKLRLLSAEMGRAGQANTRYYQLLRQRTQVEQQVSRSMAGSRQQVAGYVSTLGELRGAFGALGVGFGAQAIIGGAFNAGQEALALREMKNSLRTVAGDTANYERVLASAKNQQLLFGGSLRENIEGLTGLSITARESGASLDQLLDLSQRLAIKDPSQGIQGARIALAEALSGDPVSLAKRYEIPKAALAKLRDESASTAEKLAVIDQYLDRVGITSEAVAGRVDQDALAFRRLGAELGDLATGAGDRLASSFAKSATGLSRLVGLINGNPQAIAELRALFSDGKVDRTDLDQAAREVAGSRARDSLGGSRGAPAVARRLGGAEQYNQVAQQLTQIQLRGGEAARAAELLTQKFMAGSVGAQQYIITIAGLANNTQVATAAINLQSPAMVAAADAAQKAREQLAEFNTALGENAGAQAISAQQAEILKLRQEGIANLLDRLSKGTITQANAELVLANKYNLTAAQIPQLIALTQQLAAARAQAAFAAAGANGAQAAAGEVAKNERESAARGIRTLTNVFTGAGADIRGELAQQHQAELQLRLAQAKTNAERVAILSRELGMTKDKTERLRLQTQIANLQGNEARSHTGELTKQLNLEERIADSKEKQLRTAIDARLALLDDRKQRRIEDQEIRRAQRILADPNQSGAFKAAAADVLERIPLEQAARQLDIREKFATAGGQIVNGRIMQGDRAAAAAGALPALPANMPTIPAAAGAAAGAPGAGAGVEVNVYLDGAEIAANVVTRMRGSFDAARSGGNVSK